MGKLVQVDTFTVSSAVAQVNIGGGTSSSSSTNFAINTDDVYMIAFKNVAPETDNQDLRIRFIKSDYTVDTSTNIAYAMKRFRTASTFANVYGSTTGVSICFGVGNASGENANGLLYIYNANNSSEYTFLTNETSYMAYVPEFYGTNGGFVHQSAEQVTGIHFYMGTGNIDVGSQFTLYKVL